MSLSSSAGSGPSISVAAAEGARRLINLCPKRKDVDPREFVLSLAYVLHPYSDDVISYVTDPRTGVPAKRYPLQISDVVEACARRQSQLALEEEMRRPRTANAQAWPRRGWLGMQFSRPLGRKSVHAITCDAGGPAECTGVRTGDLISNDALRALGARRDELKAGDVVTLSVLRLQQELSFEIVAGVMPE
jgi:hypothetical protein